MSKKGRKKINNFHTLPSLPYILHGNSVMHNDILLILLYVEVYEMVEEKVVSNGYIKLLALYIGHLETEIIMERNTNSQHDIDSFKEKYNEDKNIIIFIIHMDYDDDIKFSDYQKVRREIHCFDYLRDILIKKNGKIIHRNDIENRKLYNIKG